MHSIAPSQATQVQNSVGDFDTLYVTGYLRIVGQRLQQLVPALVSGWRSWGAIKLDWEAMPLPQDG